MGIPLNFSGEGTAESASTTLKSGQIIRARFLTLKGSALLRMKIVVDSVTTLVDIDEGDLWVSPALPGDTVSFVYDGQGNPESACQGTADTVTSDDNSAASSTPLTGTANASTTVGPFTPQLARNIRLTLSGTWVGTVQVLRSADGGATKLPLTLAGGGWASFTANCNETVENESEAAATYYLSITLASGSVTYRVAQ